MLKTLNNIQNISSIEIIGNENKLLPLNDIQYNENIGGGGFGEVFKVVSINGEQKKALVLKVITNDEAADHSLNTIKILHTKIKKALLNEPGFVFQHHSELIGLPFLAFSAYDLIEEKSVVALLIHDLNQLGYEDFGSDSFNTSKYAQFDISSKIYSAFSLVKCINFLNKLNFLHSDISENSIWINYELNKIALIDYDSGFHFDLQNKPTTVGKIGHWIGSTFRKILAKEINSDDLTLTERLNEEKWVVSNALFQLIFSVSPFFFLKDADEKIKNKYLKKYRWPEVSFDDDLFNSANQNAHNQVFNLFNQLTESGLHKLTEGFTECFNLGYKNTNRRLSIQDWYRILFEICEGLELKPEILSFKGDKSKIYSIDEEVAFKWKSKRGNKIFINDKLITNNFYSTSFNDSSKVELKIVNEFGQTSQFFDIVAVKVAPVIKLFKSDKDIRIDLNPILLTWKTEHAKSIKITDIFEDLPENGEYAADVKEDKTITIIALGNFNEEVSTSIAIKVIQPKIVDFKYEINIEKGIDNIDLLWETKDAIEVIIEPRIGKVDNNGQTSIGIIEKTEFTLKAVGYFGETQKTISTQPFPIPLIKSILIPMPSFNQNMEFEKNAFSIPTVVFKDLKIDFNQNINFNTEIPEFNSINNQIDLKDEKIESSHFFNTLFHKIFK